MTYHKVLLTIPSSCLKDPVGYLGLDKILRVIVWFQTFLLMYGTVANSESTIKKRCVEITYVIFHPRWVLP